MKRILWLIVATFAICLTTLTTYAQSSLKLRFSVPFAFTAQNTVFPAGEYEVTQADRYVLRLRNVETQASGWFEHVQPKSRTNGGGSAEVVFHCYGAEYFLARVTDGTANSAYDLRQSEQERRLANGGSNPQPKVVSVLANGGGHSSGDGRK